MEGMFHLAALSRDARVRVVASEWITLDKAQRQNIEPEMLCERAGPGPEEFIGAVLKVAYELQVDVSPMIGAMIMMPHALAMTLDHACLTGERLEQVFAGLEAVGRSVQRGKSRHQCSTPEM